MVKLLVDNNLPITCGDFLAGGGGVTYAMQNVRDLNCRWVLNHNATAIRTNVHNNKGIKHYWADFYKQDEHEMEPVDFVWASIECTQHSRANAGRDKKVESYTLGWELVRYIKYLKPNMIGIENVPEFKDWAPVDRHGQPIKTKKGKEFQKWKRAICKLGYTYTEHICNAADYGLPTRRVRFFCYFTRTSLNITIPWPALTHSKKQLNGLKPWEPCRPFIDLKKEGESIFGRALNPNINKTHRRQLSINTLKRIAGGIKKYHPEMYMIFQYYGNGLNVQSIESPLNTVTTKDRHVLVKWEKLQFIQDHCRAAVYNTAGEPLSVVLTRETKRLVTVDFLSDGTFGTENKTTNLDEPTSAITSQQRHQLIQGEINFLSLCNNSNGNPAANNSSLDGPLNSITTHEKQQFISAYFSSSGNQGSQNQSLDNPLNSITTGANKQALVTGVYNGEFDFDIKMRFLDPEELATISTFPKGYFTDPRLKLSRKAATKLIGNAVPPEWAKILIEPAVAALREAMVKENLNNQVG